MCDNVYETLEIVRQFNDVGRIATQKCIELQEDVVPGGHIVISGDVLNVVCQIVENMLEMILLRQPLLTDILQQTN